MESDHFLLKNVTKKQIKKKNFNKLGNRIITSLDFQYHLHISGPALLCKRKDKLIDSIIIISDI